MVRKKELDEEDIKKAVKLYETGMSVLLVARQLEFNLNSTSKSLSDLGVFRKSGHRTQWVGNEHIKCSKCKKTKALEHIVYNIRNTELGTGYYMSYCKDCRKKQQITSREGKPVTWKLKASRIGTKCKKYGKIFNIVGSDLERLWELQEGKCMYTGENMVNAQGYGINPLAVSVDKIECDKGYIKGNIVLCTARANSIKYNQTLTELEEWMPLWYARLMEARHVWEHKPKE